MWPKRAVVVALMLVCGCGGSSTSPSAPSGPANIAGNWTYRQQAPASCPLPTQHRNLTFSATLTAQGGSVYRMSLAGTDSLSYSYFYWAGSSYRANILYSRTTVSEYVVFTVHEAPFSISGNTMSASAAGEYQYLGPTLVDCMGTFTITLMR